MFSTEAENLNAHLTWVGSLPRRHRRATVDRRRRKSKGVPIGDRVRRHARECGVMAFAGSRSTSHRAVSNCSPRARQAALVVRVTAAL
jgi:hypothetical protein